MINNKWIAFKSIWYDFMYSIICRYRHTHTYDKYSWHGMAPIMNAPDN